MLGLRRGVWIVLLAVGCGDGTEAETDTDAGGTVTDGSVTETGETGGAPSLVWSIRGRSLDFETRQPVPLGHCILAQDPDPAVVGGVPDVMSRSTADANGEFVLSGLERKPQFGVLLANNDCEGTASTGPEVGTYLLTSTPIIPDAYAIVQDGGELAEQTTYALRADYLDQVSQDLLLAGHTGDAVSQGLIVGFVTDSAGAPLGGATMSAFVPVYYLDDDPSDGMFSTAGVPNTSTSAAAGAVYAIPGADVSTYVAIADGFTFTSQLAGVDPYRAMVLIFRANP